MPLSRTFTLFWFVCLLIVFAWLAMHGKTLYHYSSDEAMHVQIAQQQSLSDVWRYAHYEVHPPALYFLLHYWMKISDNYIFVRCFSLFCCIGAIIAYYHIGKTLNGQMTGLLCAVLAAFSHGLVIQSYVVRHYAPFSFFLALGFYFFLRWQHDRQLFQLTAYFLCGLLACLTHFSGIFAIFALAGYETFFLLTRPRIDRTACASWIAINLFIAAITAVVFYLWAPILKGMPLAPHLNLTINSTLLVYMLIYPVSVLDYLLPNYYLSFAVFVMIVWLLATPKKYRTGNEGFRLFFLLTAFAYGFGELLFASGIYYVGGNRRNIWLLPFTLPALAWMAEIFFYQIKSLLSRRLTLPGARLSALLVLLIGLALYNPSGRAGVSSTQESTLLEPYWQEMSGYLGHLNSKEMIVAEKDDAIALADVYAYMGNMAFTGDSMTALAPYEHTQILFNPFYKRFYNKKVFMDTLEQARIHHLLDNVDTLVFLRLQWTHASIVALLYCSGLDKGIISFPPINERAPTDNELRQLNMAVIRVPKEVFFRDVVSPSGKAHSCLDDARDVEP